MQDISVFDVIGPIMVGPSSSHTAGAARMGYLTGALCKGRIVKAAFTLYGSFARTASGHGTDKALLGGVLGFTPEDVRIRDSFEWARKAGVEYSFETNLEEMDVHPNTADISLWDEEGKVLHVRGKSIGGGKVVIENINGINVNFTGNYTTIVIKHKDTAGMVAFIGTALGKRGINIAFMRLYREGKGDRAYTIIEADETIPPEVIRDMEQHHDIEEATLLTV